MPMRLLLQSVKSKKGSMHRSIAPEILEKVNSWLNGPYDAETKREISTLLEQDPEKLIDAFYTDLHFGTGGLRALMGVGTNRLNRYTIQMTTQALANYLLKKGAGPLSVVIGFDSRLH